MKGRVGLDEEISDSWHLMQVYLVSLGRSQSRYRKLSEGELTLHQSRGYVKKGMELTDCCS